MAKPKSMGVGVVFIALLLVLLACAGLGLGGWLVTRAAQLLNSNAGGEAGAVTLIGFAMLPLILASASLAGVGVIFAVDQARREATERSGY